MADSKNTPTLDYAKAREFAEWLAGDGAATTDGNGRNFARCYLERVALLGECRVMLALFERMAQFDTPACISFAERDAARALFYRISKEQT